MVERGSGAGQGPEPQVNGLHTVIRPNYGRPAPRYTVRETSLRKMDRSKHRDEMLILRDVDSLARQFPARAGEWFLSIGLFMWGAVVAAPTTNAFQAPSLHYLLSLGPEMAWGIGAVLIAAVRLIFLIVNGSWQRSPHLRAMGAFATCFFWTELSISAAVGGTPTTGLAIFPMLLAFDVYNLVRALRDARIADSRQPV